MNKYKVGDKFIAEITDIEYGPYIHYKINNIKGLKIDKTDLDALQPYKEPTLVDMARKIQDNCEIFVENECAGCKLTNGEYCTLLTYGPNKWELYKLEQEPKLTEEERDILEFWMRQGADYIELEGEEIIAKRLIDCFGDKKKLSIGGQNNIAERFKRLKKGTAYKIDDLLKGE